MRDWSEEIGRFNALPIEELDRMVEGIMSEGPRTWTTSRRIAARLISGADADANLSPIMTACSASRGWAGASIRVSASLRRLVDAGVLESDDGARTLRYRRVGE